jgi:hemoglobin
MRPIKVFAVLAVMLFSFTSSYAQESLYKRLGGYDAIASVTDDFIVRLATSEQLAKFFKGASADSQKKIRQHVVDLICEKTGGPCFYLGRSMKSSHAGLGITDHEWEVSVALFIESLDKFHVPDTEKNELLAIVSSVKADIVEAR